MLPPASGAGKRLGRAIEPVARRVSDEADVPIASLLARCEQNAPRSRACRPRGAGISVRSIGALRGYDRVRRAEPARKAGHPERRSERVAAFRLVEFTTGSAVATLESAAREEQDEALFDDQEDPAIENLGALADQLARDEALDAEVLDALDSARRALGEDGCIGLSLPGQDSALTIDRERIELLRGQPSDDASTVGQVSGRLHLIDLEPGRIGIRTPTGVEWSCRYGEELEETVKKLIDKVVVADGEGRLTQPAARFHGARGAETGATP